MSRYCREFFFFFLVFSIVFNVTLTVLSQYIVQFQHSIQDSELEVYGGGSVQKKFPIFMLIFEAITESISVV